MNITKHDSIIVTHTQNKDMLQCWLEMKKEALSHVTERYPRQLQNAPVFSAIIIFQGTQWTFCPSKHSSEKKCIWETQFSNTGLQMYLPWRRLYSKMVISALLSEGAEGRLAELWKSIGINVVLLNQTSAFPILFFNRYGARCSGYPSEKAQQDAYHCQVSRQVESRCYRKKIDISKYMPINCVRCCERKYREWLRSQKLHLIEMGEGLGKPLPEITFKPKPVGWGVFSESKGNRSFQTDGRTGVKALQLAHCREWKVALGIELGDWEGAIWNKLGRLTKAWTTTQGPGSHERELKFLPPKQQTAAEGWKGWGAVRKPV